jgi:large subunit ribosomal protein L16
MLMPKRTKHRKQHRAKIRSHPKGGTAVNFGEFGLQAMHHGYLTNRQIESARIAMTRHMKRGGKVWITIYPDRPVTKKPAETRQGSGKGNPEEWVAAIRPGRVLFELSGVSEEIAKEALRLAAHKLPLRTRFLRRGEIPVA